jgi:Ser/Thr protein kinase RdoA (MazF antagonist)
VVITDIELTALAEAIDRLHRATPMAVLADIDVAGNLGKAESNARQMAAGCNIDGLDPATRDAYHAALAWLDVDWPGRAAPDIRRPVFAQGDGNLANYLWDGRGVRIVDFEDAGRGDRVQELAEFVEHLAVWNRGGIDAEPFLDRFELSAAEQLRATRLRRLFAVFWLMMLLPGRPSHHRNPAGTLDRQASRLLGLLDR